MSSVAASAAGARPLDADVGAVPDAPDVAVVYVTHRQEEIDALGFDNVLHLGASSSRRPAAAADAAGAAAAASG